MLIPLQLHYLPVHRLPCLSVCLAWHDNKFDGRVITFNTAHCFHTYVTCPVHLEAKHPTVTSAHSTIELRALRKGVHNPCSRSRQHPPGLRPNWDAQLRRHLHMSPGIQRMLRQHHMKKTCSTQHVRLHCCATLCISDPTTIPPFRKCRIILQHLSLYTLAS